MTPLDFEGRAARLREELVAAGVDVAVLLEPRDQFYLTGIGLKGAVVVPADGSPVHLVQLNVERAVEESAVDDVRPSRGVGTVADVVAETTETGSPTVGLETDVLPVEDYRELTDAIHAAEFVGVGGVLLDLRRRKSAAELDRLERAAEISREALEGLPDAFEDGITEIELKSKLQRVKRGAGAEDGMWSRTWDQHLDFGILASGPNTAVISGHWVTMTGNGPSPAQPYGAGHRAIRDGDVVVVDHGTVFRGYHSDEARTYVVGEPTDRQRDAHAALVAAIEAAENAVEPGRPISAIYDAAHEVVAGTEFAERFMGLDRVGFEYLGHQVGLDIDETPLITPWADAEIESGMVFAIEPKFLWAGEYGVDLEDTVVATEDGSRRLTTTPRELFRI